MVRENDILIPSTTRWLFDPAARAVCEALGGEVLFVGGCVRNALMDLPDSDVDMSTPILPQEVMRRASKAGLKAVPTGIEHGTVTVVSGAEGFEITTFRRDIATDGRRAVVAFSEDIKDDARRRDFTMNALYATPDGTVIDPLGGLPDLIARRVRFIENASHRIREDYLRILRYFRFHAWYGADKDGFDPDALNAISENLSGLKTLSAERVGAELSKLLKAVDPVFAVAGMRHSGVLTTILPAADDHFLGPLIHNETIVEAHRNWLCRLAVLGGDGVARRLRLSRSDQKELVLIGKLGFGGMPLKEAAYRHGLRAAICAHLIRTAVAEQPADRALITTLENAACQVFPIRGADLQDRLQGPALGEALRTLEASWIQSDFSLSRSTLLDEI